MRTRKLLGANHCFRFRGERRTASAFFFRCLLTGAAGIGAAGMTTAGKGGIAASKPPKRIIVLYD